VRSHHASTHLREGCEAGPGWVTRTGASVHVFQDICCQCKAVVSRNRLAARDCAMPCLGMLGLQSATLAHCRMLGCQAQRPGGCAAAQADELRALSGLAAEAAEILFEMAAMHDASEVARDMLEKAAQLQAQLRGMIGDFRDGDETALAQARQHLS